MVPCAYAHGWLATVAPSSIAAGVEALAKIAPVTTAGVLIAECAGLAALVHRRATIGLLAIWIVLHVSIFLAVGYFFLEMDRRQHFVDCRAGSLPSRVRMHFRQDLRLHVRVTDRRVFRMVSPGGLGVV